jgi:hypothetical protein
MHRMALFFVYYSLPGASISIHAFKMLEIIKYVDVQMTFNSNQFGVNVLCVKQRSSRFVETEEVAKFGLRSLEATEFKSFDSN